MPKRILLLEDDFHHRDSIENRVKRRWNDIEFEFIPITSEREFNRRFDEIAAAGVDLAIIDQMIPYMTDDDELDEQERKQALELSPFKGGTRCFNRLREDTRTRRVPAVFYTILARDEKLPDNVPYVQKSGDPTLENLLVVVGKVIQQ